jgi:hypothetical protein
MRASALLACFAGALLLASPAQAERRIFVIANNADGYGVDRCLATGARCGSTIASAYCRARAFDHAVSFRKVERAEITGMIMADAPGCRGVCAGFIAIECGR